MQPIPHSDLIINPNGSIYHLCLLPEQLADTVITVGDPGRVADVSKHFDHIEHRVQNREFITHTGTLHGKRLTVVSTGIGTDNIDIAFTELDALANIDFNTRTAKKEFAQLNIIRMGTSGAVSEDVPLDSIVISETAIGMDNLMAFYKHHNNADAAELLQAFSTHISGELPQIQPYIGFADSVLLQRFQSIGIKGLTVTAPGFYAPQGRLLRVQVQWPNLLKHIHSFKHKQYHIANFEMETAAIYALGGLLGHRCLSVSAIVAHRISGKFSANPQKAIDDMITHALQTIVAA